MFFGKFNAESHVYRCKKILLSTTMYIPVQDNVWILCYVGLLYILRYVFFFFFLQVIFTNHLYHHLSHIKFNQAWWRWVSVEKSYSVCTLNVNRSWYKIHSFKCVLKMKIAAPLPLGLWCHASRNVPRELAKCPRWQ